MADEIFKFELGAKVRNIITGFQGVVVSRTQYLNGCVRFGVQPEKLTKEGKTADSEWCDVQELQLVKPPSAALQAAATSGPAGGPQRNPPRR